MNNVVLPTSPRHKHLRLVINSSLSWKDHIDVVYTSCARQIGILARLRGKLPWGIFAEIFSGFIRPRMEFACVLLSEGNRAKLERVQDHFCRHQVCFPPLTLHFDYHTQILFYKIKNSLTPAYLIELLPKSLTKR